MNRRLFGHDSRPSHSDDPIVSPEEAGEVFDHFSGILGRIGSGNFNEEGSVFDAYRVTPAEPRAPGIKPIAIEDAMFVRLTAQAARLLPVVGRLTTSASLAKSTESMLLGAHTLALEWVEERDTDPTYPNTPAPAELVQVLLRQLDLQAPRGYVNLTGLYLNGRTAEGNGIAEWSSQRDYLADMTDGEHQAYAESRMRYMAEEGRDLLRRSELGPLHLLADVVDAQLPALMPGM